MAIRQEREMIREFLKVGLPTLLLQKEFLLNKAAGSICKTELF